MGGLLTGAAKPEEVKVSIIPASVHEHPCFLARGQYRTMADCEHLIDEHAQRCDRCMGRFGQIHSQHTFLHNVIANHDPGYGHMRELA